jgi:hypothetical protein
MHRQTHDARAMLGERAAELLEVMHHFEKPGSLARVSSLCARDPASASEPAHPAGTG